MSNYIFAPCPSFGISEHPFVTYRDAFSEQELTQLTKHLDSLEKTRGVVGNNNDSNNQIRRSSVSWLSLDNDSQWIYDRLAFVARILNGQFYKFDLYGFNEPMQYTTYSSEEQGHYSWHVDSGINQGATPPRKFSMILQLSDPVEYVGGDLQIMTQSEPQSIDKQKGLIAAFPSYVLHRVTPVTQGIRKTLVVWVSGPSFK